MRGLMASHGLAPKVQDTAQKDNDQSRDKIRLDQPPCVRWRIMFVCCDRRSLSLGLAWRKFTRPWEHLNCGISSVLNPNFKPSISQFLATVCTQPSPIAVTVHLPSRAIPPTNTPAELVQSHHASQDSLSRSSLACARVAGRAPKDTRT